MTDSEAELRRGIDDIIGDARYEAYQAGGNDTNMDLHDYTEDIMSLITNHDKTVGQAAKLFLLDKLIESEAVKEPVMIGQNALPFKVVTVATLNNERRRLLAALQTNQPGDS